MRIKVLGIDVGTIATGWAVVVAAGTDCVYSDSGVHRLSPRMPLRERMDEMSQWFGILITQKNPDLVAIETQYVHKNAQTAMKLAALRGRFAGIAGTHNIPTTEISPRQAKMYVAGTGNATKQAVRQCLNRQFGLKLDSLDESDALAVAVAARLATLKR